MLLVALLLTKLTLCEPFNNATNSLANRSNSRIWTTISVSEHCGYIINLYSISYEFLCFVLLWLSYPFIVWTLEQKTTICELNAKYFKIKLYTFFVRFVTFNVVFNGNSTYSKSLHPTLISIGDFCIFVTVKSTLSANLSITYISISYINFYFFT
jgi:hypothetical protein